MHIHTFFRPVLGSADIDVDGILNDIFIMHREMWVLTTTSYMQIQNKENHLTLVRI